MKKILIVEDETDIVETIRFPLETLGYNCSVALDGMEAIQKIKTDNPDLIILDIVLPKMHGYKVCRLLKFDNRYKNIPIIMLTARAQEDDKKLGRETGADEYVTKPFEIKDLIKLIEKYLKK